MDMTEPHGLNESLVVATWFFPKPSLQAELPVVFYRKIFPLAGGGSGKTGTRA